MGQAVGLEMRLEGVMVAGLAAEDQGGSPAGDAGVLPGDLIVSLDGEAVSSGEQLLQGLANWDGGAMALGLRRGEKELRCEVTPEAGGKRRGTPGALAPGQRGGYRHSDLL